MNEKQKNKDIWGLFLKAVAPDIFLPELKGHTHFRWIWKYEEVLFFATNDLMVVSSFLCVKNRFPTQAAS